MIPSQTARIHILWMIACLIMLFSGLIGGYSLRPKVYVVEEDEGTPPALCVRVLDGDTIEVEWMGQSERVRILGIDAPETRRTRTLREQAKLLSLDEDYVLRYGENARMIVNNWLLERKVRLVFPGDEINRDNFGRLLCYVELQGTDIGERLLLGGNAIIYDSDHPRRETYKLFQGEAQKNRRGIWRNL